MVVVVQFEYFVDFWNFVLCVFVLEYCCSSFVVVVGLCGVVGCYCGVGWLGWVQCDVGVFGDDFKQDLEIVLFGFGIQGVKIGLKSGCVEQVGLGDFGCQIIVCCGKVQIGVVFGEIVLDQCDWFIFLQCVKVIMQQVVKCIQIGVKLLVFICYEDVVDFGVKVGGVVEICVFDDKVVYGQVGWVKLRMIIVFVR